MVKKLWVGALLLLSFTAVPRPADAGCTRRLADCYVRASRIDSFWYRWAEGLDCELDYVSCARERVVGY